MMHCEKTITCFYLPAEIKNINPFGPKIQQRLLGEGACTHLFGNDALRKTDFLFLSARGDPKSSIPFLDASLT